MTMSKKKAPDDTLDMEKDMEDDGSSAAGQESAAADGQNSKDAQLGEQNTKEEEELNTRYLRLAADFQNFRKRVEKEKNDIYAYANEKIVVELLDVIDNFERALEHSNNNDGFAEGMNMIFKQFKGVLEKSGVEEMNVVGEDFDPSFHHAVLTENSAEYESGKITQVLQKGYMLNKKVVRPAMVKVAE